MCAVAQTQARCPRGGSSGSSSQSSQMERKMPNPIEWICYVILMRFGRWIPLKPYVWLCSRASGEAARRGEW
jgi:hypothetical protein